MHYFYDPDEWEAIREYKPCSVCKGDPSKCNGMCNGFVSFGSKRRSPEEVAAIKLKKRLEKESRILAEAKKIEIRRSLGW